jgi:hypothetical protein
MHESASKPPGREMLDAMIARAEASCERARAALERTSDSKRPHIIVRRTRLKTMEDTLARLKARWGGRAP